MRCAAKIAVLYVIPTLCFIIWARGWWYSDTIAIVGSRSMAGFTTSGGMVSVVGSHDDVSVIEFLRSGGPIAPDGWLLLDLRWQPPDARWMDWWWPEVTTIPGVQLFMIPWWIITTIALLPALIHHFPPLRRWRRRRSGLCEYCAYPRGTSAVCTECGRPPRRTMTTS